MIQAILNIILRALGLSESIADNKGKKIPFQEVSIKSEASKDAVSDSLRVDHKKDRHLRNERKIVYEFGSYEDYLQGQGVNDIYKGTREQVLEWVRTDPARAIRGTRVFWEQHDILKTIEKSDAGWFIVAVHPVTVH